jgi:hypothetical protein
MTTTAEAVKKIRDLGFRKDQFTAQQTTSGAVVIFFDEVSSFDAEAKARQIARAGFRVYVIYHRQWGGEIEAHPHVHAVTAEDCTTGTVLEYWERSKAAG